MIINMTTIAVRQRRYIDRTLDSLANSDGCHLPVNLILGSKDSSHIEQYRGVVANIVPWNQKAQFLSREGNMRHNCSVNAVRALNYADDEYCLTCEDDVFFQKTWYSRLMDTIPEIERKDYVLNLAFGETKTTHHHRFEVTPLNSLCGAQGLFYPNQRLRHAVGAFVERNITRGLNDALVGYYALKFAALYNTVPALIYHIGQKSCFIQD